MKKLFILPLLMILGTSCNRFDNKAVENTTKERIVCISKQYTEFIFALGAEKDLVAVDISSVYPPAAKQLPTVGYHRALSIEGILANKPTLIFHDNNIAPEHVVKQLQDLKIPMKNFMKGETLDSTKLLLREMGAYFKQEKRADSLCQKLDKDMQEALDKAKQYTQSPKVLIIHFGQASNVYLVMTKKSTAAKMIAWAGGTMAVDDVKGMRQLSAEVVAAANPDVIILTDFGYDRLGTKEKILELPGIAATKAAQNNRIYRFEENNLVYLSPRTGENVLKLQQIIHEKPQP